MNEIKLFKMMSGEEILGTVVGYSNNRHTLNDVVAITYHPTEGGQMVAGFAPYMPYSAGDIVLHHHAIAIVADVEEAMLEEYKRIFGRIITPPKEIIV